jgi:predicted CoA-binding protein
LRIQLLAYVQIKVIAVVEATGNPSKPTHRLRATCKGSGQRILSVNLCGNEVLATR